ncbi:MAG: hypothetical protein VW039_10525, partial [Halieaceae bacterium]
IGHSFDQFKIRLPVAGVSDAQRYAQGFIEYYQRPVFPFDANPRYVQRLTQPRLRGINIPAYESSMDEL